MTRFSRAVQLAAIAAGCTMALSCTSHDQPGDHDALLGALPGKAVGVVSVGPIQPPIMSREDRTTVFTFDENGALLGRLQGGAIYDSQVLAAPQAIVTTSSDSVTKLSTSAKTSTAVDEDMVQAAAIDPATGRASVFFNSGNVDGRYSNRFVSLGRDNTAVKGTLPGMALAVGYCADRLFVVAEKREGAAEDGRPYTSVLYEVSPTGSLTERTAWDYPAGLRPATRSLRCSPDGASLFTLYASAEARSSETGDPGMTLVRFTTTDGARTEIQLDMKGSTWRVSRGTLTYAHDRLYWSTLYGDILSVPVDGSAKVTRHWRLPASHLRTKIELTPTTVAQVDYQGTPSYSTFDLVTGERKLGPISLPWLTAMVDSATESKETTYTITDIAVVSE